MRNVFAKFKGSKVPTQQKTYCSLSPFPTMKSYAAAKRYHYVWNWKINRLSSIHTFTDVPIRTRRDA